MGNKWDEKMLNSQESAIPNVVKDENEKKINVPRNVS